MGGGVPSVIAGSIGAEAWRFLRRRWEPCARPAPSGLPGFGGASQPRRRRFRHADETPAASARRAPGPRRRSPHPRAPARASAPPCSPPRAGGAARALRGCSTCGRSASNGWANEYYSAAVRSMSAELARLPVRLLRRRGRDDRRQAAAGAVGPGAVGARVRLRPLAMLVPAGAHGRGGGRARLRPRPAGASAAPAGFIAGLVLAPTPIAVADLRHNNPDALLVLCCTGRCGRWCAALEDGRTRWLVLAGVCVGLGFEAKMGAALLVVPGLAAAWLWVAPRGRSRRCASCSPAARRWWRWAARGRC